MDIVLVKPTALIRQEHACNGGHLHFQSFLEYARHLISAPEG